MAKQTDFRNPLMQTVWTVLECAKDAGDAHVVSACRRLIVANRASRVREHRADVALVLAFAA